MSVALYFVTHEGVATHLLKIASRILRQPVDNFAYIEIPMDANVETCTNNAIKAIKQLNIQSGLIIVTDLYGSTPGNIAQKLAHNFQANLISGINLPMLLRLLNYRNETLNTLTEKAINGGRNGIQQHQQAIQ